MRQRPDRSKRERQPHYDMPKALQGIGLAITVGFLLWALAMVVMQAWQAAPIHRK